MSSRVLLGRLWHEEGFDSFGFLLLLRGEGGRSSPRRYCGSVGSGRRSDTILQVASEMIILVFLLLRDDIRRPLPIFQEVVRGDKRHLTAWTSPLTEVAFLSSLLELSTGSGPGNIVILHLDDDHGGRRGFSAFARLGVLGQESLERRLSLARVQSRQPGFLR